MYIRWLTTYLSGFVVVCMFIRMPFESKVSISGPDVILTSAWRIHTQTKKKRKFSIKERSTTDFNKLGRYHDIIEYRDINLETISISDGFGFNRNIDVSRYIAIIATYRDID